METIVIAILVVIVLIVIVAFFVSKMGDSSEQLDVDTQECSNNNLAISALGYTTVTERDNDECGDGFEKIPGTNCCGKK